ncbi:MAG: hypothetical protein A2031_09610 [Deltaproteobacteria bacterium RBG_19FT_COMBO_43_11]|nr:MAG: hypothetical protein A2W27_10250 [Deltaproteobacteria bacterium RBG_16_44_11]OGP88596.1 MAG: hypothetical protein A2031_09610 [Deltaproteobacteria bacterium RBG_19FT_COMBO_43_11]
MRRLLTLAMLFIVLLSGCAATSMVAPDRKPDLTPRADSATLVIIRDTSFGFAIVFWNYLDGKLIGETKGKTYFVTNVKPGPHYVVVATENAAVAHINFQAGKSYYLREGVIMGVWRARTNGFSPLNKQEAIEAMNNCTYMEYNAKSGGEDMDPKLYQQAIANYHEEIKKNPDGFKSMLEYKGY